MATSPPIVLVHGAWEGGWVWGRVARLLREAGCEVHTPTLTGCGERAHLLTRQVSLATHVEDVASLLLHEDLRGAVLVGHSYGGTVVTGVADREPERVGRVVYLDASAPVEGQNATGAFAGASSVKLDTEGDAWLAQPILASIVGVTRPDDVAWFDARRHPHPLRSLQEPMHLDHPGAHLPRAYVRCADHAGLVAAFGVDPLAPFVARAQAEGWPLRTLDAPHAAHVVAPREVARALLDLVPGAR